MNFLSSLWLRLTEWWAWSKEFDIVRGKAVQVYAGDGLFPADESAVSERKRLLDQIRKEHACGRLSEEDIEKAIHYGQAEAHGALIGWGC